MPENTMEKELAALIALPDDQIDLSDAPELTDAQWSQAVRGKFYKPVKQQLTVRIDADVLAWLKKQSDNGRGYQSRMNQILRAAMMDSIKSSVKMNPSGF